MKYSVDYIKTLDLITSDQYSEPLPAGNYLGLGLYFYGTHSGSVDPVNALGVVKVLYQGIGDIFRLDVVKLQTLNNFFGGRPDSTAGTAFHAFALIPFKFFGVPNALHITDNTVVKVWLEKCKATATTWKCDILGIYGNAPQNYIPIVSQDRITALGGLQSQTIAIRNLIALWLSTASTTNPDLISVASRDYTNSFGFAEAQYLSDILFNVESASLSSIVIPFMFDDLADVVSDRVAIKLSGGSGYMDFITMSALFTPKYLRATRHRVLAERTEKYNRITSGTNVSLVADEGDISGFDADALRDSKL